LKQTRFYSYGRIFHERRIYTGKDNPLK